MRTIARQEPARAHVAVGRADVEEGDAEDRRPRGEADVAAERQSEAEAGGRLAGVELEPNVLLIFGKVEVGTPLMQADPRAGVELPLRMLIWQDSDGTHVGYLDPRELTDRYALDGHQETLERQAAVLAKLADAAAG